MKLTKDDVLLLTNPLVAGVVLAGAALGLLLLAVALPLLALCFYGSVAYACYRQLRRLVLGDEKPPRTPAGWAVVEAGPGQGAAPALALLEVPEAPAAPSRALVKPRPKRWRRPPGHLRLVDAQAAAPAPRVKAVTGAALKRKTVDDLRALAKKAGVKGVSGRWTKETLVARILKAGV